MLGEVTHLQTISDDLKALTSDPHKLPPASEQVRKIIQDRRPVKQLTSISHCIPFWSCRALFI